LYRAEPWLDPEPRPGRPARSRRGLPAARAPLGADRGPALL